jgi:hypothetical protein
MMGSSHLRPTARARPEVRFAGLPTLDERTGRQCRYTAGRGWRGRRPIRCPRVGRISTNTRAWDTNQQVRDSFALVAQWTRASDYGSEGWGFESLRARWISPGQGVFGSDACPQGVAVRTKTVLKGSSVPTKPEGVYQDSRGGWYFKVSLGTDPAYGTAGADHPAGLCHRIGGGTGSAGGARSQGLRAGAAGAQAVHGR